MAERKGSSPIPSSVPDKNVDDSSMELDPSGAQWLGPENQLGLEPDDQEVDLESWTKKVRFKHNETIVIYLDLPRQSQLHNPSRQHQKRDG
jgi:hypothetical protein